VQEYEVSGK